VSGFIASPNAGTGDIANAPFFPVIAMSELRAVARIDGTIPDERLIEAATVAMSAVNTDLAGYQADREAEGITSLAEVPAAALGGRSRLVRLYLRAVYAMTKADLLERYRDFDASNSGRTREEDLDKPAAEHRRNARLAIREILGVPRVTAELI